MKTSEGLIKSAYLVFFVQESEQYYISIVCMHVNSLNSVKYNFMKSTTSSVSIYTLIDLGVLSNLIGSLSLANEHYSPPTE